MKAARTDYHDEPFYYSEIFEESARTIAWHKSTAAQKEIFYQLLDLCNDWVDFLFKENPGNCESYNDWLDITGGILKADLLDLIQINEEWFFNDSIFQFFFKNSDSASYIAYDEHGIFYLHNFKNGEKVLKDIGINYAVRELIHDKPHWEIRPAYPHRGLKKFKQHLKSKSFFYEEEAKQVIK